MDKNRDVPTFRVACYSVAAATGSMQHMTYMSSCTTRHVYTTVYSVLGRYGIASSRMMGAGKSNGHPCMNVILI